MKNKTFLVLLLTLSFFRNTSAQDCLPDGIIFSSQKQIDLFRINYPKCTNILGHVIIKESADSSIRNLEGLFSLIHIKGNLSITDNKGLSGLQALPNLEVIEGNVYIQSNSSLKNLVGLEGLSKIKQEFYIIDNPTLENLKGLDKLSTIGGFLHIQRNASLSSLSGLDSLSSLGGHLIYDNPFLIDLNGLDTITAGNIIIKKKQPHVMMIKSSNKSLNHKGYLRSAIGNEVVTSNMINENNKGNKRTVINVTDIEEIQFRKRNKSALKGAVIGAIIVAPIASLASLAQGFSGQQSGGFAVPVIFIVGAGLGAAAGGSGTIKIPINGSKNELSRHRGEILKYKIGD